MNLQKDNIYLSRTTQATKEGHKVYRYIKKYFLYSLNQAVGQTNVDFKHQNRKDPSALLQLGWPALP